MSSRAGAGTAELCISVINAGGYGSLACARTAPDIIRKQIKQVRDGTDGNNRFGECFKKKVAIFFISH
jgi:NAD(P)H-dependent flavin oxidoreductase YrpB (nitropropane dioxygenase family)